MPLTITLADGEYRPLVVCDHCGQEIADAREGNYQWRTTPEGRPINGEVYFTHKRCCAAFEWLHAGQPAWHWAWTELCCLPIYLGVNLQLDWREARELAQRLSQL
jgi:hypothetical protein